MKHADSMKLGDIVRRLRDGKLGTIVSVTGPKIRVQSQSKPYTIWRLQNSTNYCIGTTTDCGLEEALTDMKIKPTHVTPFENSKTTTRAQYREKLSQLGVTLHSDTDVLHIISKANGGADHIDNYLFLGNMRLNRKLGNRADEIYCYLAGLEGTKRAVAASLKYGTFAQHFISPEKLYECGLARFSKIYD